MKLSDPLQTPRDGLVVDRDRCGACCHSVLGPRLGRKCYERQTYETRRDESITQLTRIVFGHLPPTASPEMQFDELPYQVGDLLRLPVGSSGGRTPWLLVVGDGTSYFFCIELRSRGAST